MYNIKKYKKDINAILILSIPIIIENILQTLLGTTDTYFAGNISDNAIASIGITNTIMNIFISFFSSISIGTSVIISRNLGQKDYKTINYSIVNSIILGCILGVIIGIICFIFKTPILKISGADLKVIEYTIPYYNIVVIPCIFLCLQLILSACLRAIKNTSFPMYISFFCNIINIILNIIFIKLNLGILGLGLATTISRLISIFFLFYKLAKTLNLKNISFKLNKIIIKSILRIGIPAGTEKLVMRIGQLIYNSMIISLGTNSYVAHSIAGTIESYSYIPSIGLGLAISTLVSLSIGENNIKKAKQLTYITYIISMVLMTFIGLLFFIFAPQLASLFTKTLETKNLVIIVLRIIAFFQPFSALVQILTNSLQGAGDTKFPMYSTFIGIWGIRIVIGYILAIPLQLGLIGVWIAYSFDLIIRGIILLYRFISNKWQNVKF